MALLPLLAKELPGGGAGTFSALLAGHRRRCDRAWCCSWGVCAERLGRDRS